MVSTEYAISVQVGTVVLIIKDFGRIPMIMYAYIYSTTFELCNIPSKQYTQ